VGDGGEVEGGEAGVREGEGGRHLEREGPRRRGGGRGEGASCALRASCPDPELCAERLFPSGAALEMENKKQKGSNGDGRTWRQRAPAEGPTPCCRG
jgi:hypothetical protein